MKRYLWYFPLLGGVLIIIGVLTPIATFYNELNIWMWGLIQVRFYGNLLEFVEDQIILYMGISLSIIIVLLSLIIIFTAYFYHIGHFSEWKIGRLWLILGSMILVGMIIYLILLDFYTYNGLFPYGIWEFLNAGFGAVGPIFGSILSIGAGSTILILEKQKRATQPPKIVLPKKIPHIKCPHCGRTLSLNARFCRECGKSIE